MKPGATTRPLASMTRRAGASSGNRPTAAMRSPRIAMSPKNQGLPVPSTTRPPRINRSKGGSSSAGADNGKARPAIRAASHRSDFAMSLIQREDLDLAELDRVALGLERDVALAEHLIAVLDERLGVGVA